MRFNISRMPIQNRFSRRRIDSMDKQEIGDVLSRSLHHSFQLEEKRNSLYQVFVPLYHDDGDMMDIYIRVEDDGTAIICDCAKTLMRLSYTFDLHTSRQEKLLDTIVRTNGADIQNGNIFIRSTANLLFENIMQMSQIIAQIDAMRFSKRHNVKNLFYEDMSDYIETDLKRFHPQKNIQPIRSRDDLVVDYALDISDRPLYLFGILGNEKALSSVISILSFQQAQLPFTSIAVHADYKSLSQTTQKKIMNAADKQFFDLDSFQGTIESFLSRFVA